MGPMTANSTHTPRSQGDVLPWFGANAMNKNAKDKNGIAA
jgi:hypothetical protein